MLLLPLVIKSCANCSSMSLFMSPTCFFFRASHDHDEGITKVHVFAVFSGRYNRLLNSVNEELITLVVILFLELLGKKMEALAD